MVRILMGKKKGRISKTFVGKGFAGGRVGPKKKAKLKEYDTSKLVGFSNSKRKLKI